MKEKVKKITSKFNPLMALVSIFSILIIISGILLYFFASDKALEKITQLTGSTAATLAAVWFTIGLWLQRKQLEDQKVQFLETSQIQRKDAQRNTLLFCKEILETTRTDILQEKWGLFTLRDLIGNYTTIPEFQILLNSENPKEIIEVGQNWTKRETPVLSLLRNLAMTEAMYLDSIDINYDKECSPESFCSINGKLVRTVSVFQEYNSIGEVLSQMVTLLKPLRESSLVAIQLAIALNSEYHPFNIEKLFIELDRIKNENYQVPIIAQNFAKRFSKI